MRIQLDRFPNGLHKALTLSFDDGRDHDRRFVRMLNGYGIKATFHLNSGFLGKEGYIGKEEAGTLYRGHEVSAHTVSHPFLEQSPPEQVVSQVVEDRKALEALVHVPIKGMSYPFGTYNDQVVSLLRAVGIEYARTVNSHGSFHMPKIGSAGIRPATTNKWWNSRSSSSVWNSGFRAWRFCTYGGTAMNSKTTGIGI